MKKVLIKLTALGILVLVVTAVSFSTMTTSAAQVGDISVTENEIQAEILNHATSGNATMDLNETIYNIVSVKVMRERIKGTAFDLPDNFEKDLLQYCRNKIPEDSPETVAILQEKNVTRNDMVDAIYNIRLNGEIMFCYVKMMAPQVIAENPDETDGYVLLDKIDGYVKEIVNGLSEIELNQAAVNRITVFAKDRNIEVI